MAISDRITSIEEHIKESYQELEGLGIDITGVDKNLENIPKLIDGYWETLPKVTEEGTSITLDNTKEGKMKINLKGNTSQEGTPTPESPQDIHVVSGDNSIEVCGKNLFNINTSLTKRYISYANGNVGTSDDWSASDFIPIQGNTNYILSGITNSGWTAGTGFYDINKNFISSIYSTVYSFTTPSNAKYVRLSLRSETPTGVMLEKGSTATTYEAYKGASYEINLGDIELCKIGTYQDRIYKDSDKWYIEKQIGKIILDETDGTASWNSWFMTEGSNFYRFQRQNWISNISTTTPEVTCNYLVYNVLNYIPNTISRFNRGLQLVLSASLEITDISTFKNWLGNNNPIVYYPLATPTTTEITDTTLLSQLEALNGAKSYTTQTNISQANNDNASILNATALSE